MRNLVCVLAVLAITSSAKAAIFMEDFNLYAGGTTSWGSGGVWNEPTNQIKLDAYTPDRSLGPRMGNTGTRDANAELENSVLNPGELGVPRIDFSTVFYWDHADSKADGFFVVLSDDPATSLLVPTDDSSTANPINAIAWGHISTNRKDYSFFDGQSWTVVGWATISGGRDDSEVVSGHVETDGSWSATSDGGGSGAGTLAVNDFSFDTVSIISQGNGSGYYCGIDDVNVSAAVRSSALEWDGGPGRWADPNWGGGQLPATGVDMIVDAAAGDSDVTVDADFNSALSVAIGQTNTARVAVDPTFTLTADDQVTLGVNGTLHVDGTLAAASLTTDPGSTLSGSGTVNAVTTINGTVAPGGSTGMLTLQAEMELGENAVYGCQIAEWDSPGGLPPVPPLPDPPMDPTINDRIHAVGSDINLDGELKLTALSKLHPRVPHPDPPHVEVEWYGDQTRVIASTEGENGVGFAFATVPDPQPESWDNIMTGTEQWSQGHIGRGVFLTRQNLGGPDDVPGVSYTPNAAKLHLFQACDGDTNGDRTLGGRDIQNIQSFALFGVVSDPGPGYVWPPGWSQGDFDGNGFVDGLDISAILATGLWPTGGYAAIEPGEPLDGVVDLLLYPEDVTLDDGTVVPAGTLMIDPDGLTLNGYVLRSADGIFTGAPAQQLNWFFVEDTDRQISGNMGATISQVQDLGPVVGPEWTIINPFDKQEVNPFDDLTFTYTVVGTPGTFVGNLIVVPEPGTLVMLLVGVLAVLWKWGRGSFCRLGATMSRQITRR